MSYFFGLTRGKLPSEQAAERDRICRELGGYGFTQIEDPPGQGQWRGWFSGPNLGEPFDRALATEVLALVALKESTT